MASASGAGVDDPDQFVAELHSGRVVVSGAVVGDTINVGSRLEGRAPIGGVLIGAETYRRLPAQTVAESWPGLKLKGKETPVDAYVLHSVPA